MLAYSIVLEAARQVWPPFVLVAGLLLVGGVAGADGLFEATGSRLACAPLPPRGLLVACLALVASVTAVLNLDTAVVFLTPVLVHVARHRGLDERPFLYGTVLMANAASLLLPGSNLTNLIVLTREHASGAGFGLRMLPAWLAACSVTAAGVALSFRLGAGSKRSEEPPPLRTGVGAAAVLAAAALVVVLRDPALPVLGIGLGASALRGVRPRVDVRALALLFAVVVALGSLARVWDGPAALLDSAGRWTTAGIASLAAVLLNNLPASALLSTQTVPHPLALLIGLDLGPNLAVTGSLSALLWAQAARSVGSHPSVATYSRLGIVLAPLAGAAALAVCRI
jgi:arsenical pump membrane protein